MILRRLFAVAIPIAILSPAAMPHATAQEKQLSEIAEDLGVDFHIFVDEVVGELVDEGESADRRGDKKVHDADSDAIRRAHEEIAKHKDRLAQQAKEIEKQFELLERKRSEIEEAWRRAEERLIRGPAQAEDREHDPREREMHEREMREREARERQDHDRHGSDRFRIHHEPNGMVLMVVTLQHAPADRAAEFLYKLYQHDLSGVYPIGNKLFVHTHESTLEVIHRAVEVFDDSVGEDSRNRPKPTLRRQPQPRPPEIKVIPNKDGSVQFGLPGTHLKLDWLKGNLNSLRDEFGADHPRVKQSQRMLDWLDQQRKPVR